MEGSETVDENQRQLQQGSIQNDEDSRDSEEIFLQRQAAPGGEGVEVQPVRHRHGKNHIPPWLEIDV